MSVLHMLEVTLAILNACTPYPEIPAPVIAVRPFIMNLDNLRSGSRFIILIIEYHHRQTGDLYTAALRLPEGLRSGISMIDYDVPAAGGLRETLGDRLHVGIIDHHDISPCISAGMILQHVSHHPAVTAQKLQTAFNLLAAVQAEGRMCPAQLNQTLVILEDRDEPLLVLPADGVDGVRAAVAVMIAEFAAQHSSPA